MNILITGANGFIGKHLVKTMLDSGNDVYAVVTNESDLNDFNSDRLHVIKAFFDEYNNLASLVNIEIDILYHFAWAGLSGEEAGNVELQLNNIKATQTLLEEASKLSVKKIVFASTMNTFELRVLLDNPVGNKTRATHIHVAAKVMTEVVLRKYCEDQNIEFNQGVIAMAYGEGNKSRMIPNVFIYSLLNGISPKLIEGNIKYDLIYVKDLVMALKLIGEKGINKKSYYIGHNWNKTFKEIFTDIKECLDSDVKLLFGAYPDGPSFTFNQINKEELFIDTGWKPMFDFKQSIINTAEWIKQSGIKF